MSKHPPIASHDYDAYWKARRRICVYKLGHAWEVERWSPVDEDDLDVAFRTHAEAIAYADQIAQEVI